MNQSRLNQAKEALRDFINRLFSKDVLIGPHVNSAYTAHQKAGPLSFKLDHEDSEYDNLIKKMCQVQTANPSSEERKKKFEATFCDNFVYENKINENHERFFKELENALRRDDYIAVVGRRGSGKTTLINKWLNNKTNIFIENKIALNCLWFRVDASKIYNSKVEPRFSVEDYFYAHAIFVFLNYCGKIPETQAVRNQYFENIYKRIDDFGKSIINQITEFCILAFEEERIASALADKSVGVVEALIKQYSRTENQLKIAFIQIARACEKERVGILAIIDGLDNVSLRYQNGRYQAVVKSAQEFMENFVRNVHGLRKKILLVTRPETVSVLEIYAVTGLTRAGGDAISILFKYIDIPVVKPSMVLMRKLSAITATEFEADRLQYLQKILIETSSASKVEMERRFDDRNNRITKINFETIIMDKINQTLVTWESGKINDGLSFWISSLTEEEFFDAIFDGDIRSYLACFRRVIHGQSLLKSVNVPNTNTDALIFELFVLSGNFYKFTSKTKEEDRMRSNRYDDADIFPNIFWYSTAGQLSPKWRGLCGLRLLQLCYFRDLSVLDTKKILHDVFDYPYDIIEDSIETFIAYGLIDVNISSITNSRNGGNKKEKHKDAVESPNESPKNIPGTLETTLKGQVCASLALSYSKWLYFIGLDTPILKQFSQGVMGNKYVRFYRHLDSLHKAEFHFWDAVIPTASVFIRHVNHFHIDEMVQALERLEKQPAFDWFEEIGMDVDLLLNRFDLPKNWLEYQSGELERLLEARANDDRPQHKQVTSFSELADLIIGWDRNL